MDTANQGDDNNMIAIDKSSETLLEESIRTNTEDLVEQTNELDTGIG